MARVPNQCMHIMVDGVHCGSPAMRRNRFCYHHKRQREQRTALNAEIMRLLAAGQIDRQTASLMLYSLQIATSNLPYATLDELP
jgi:hypothetical protein